MKKHVHLWRDRHGVPHVEARNEVDLYWGQGRVHATDRGMQMLLMRILGQGRASELLTATDAALRLDTFFRRMNWSAGSDRQLRQIGQPQRACVQSYCDGANSVFQKRIPWELKLFGYRPEPWRIEDTILISRMLGYLTLVASQAEMERLLVEMVQAGVGRDRLEALFPGILGGLDVELLRQVELCGRTVPPEVVWHCAAPRATASNNWVVSGGRTASGKPILANDPHLEGNRLPNVWCEIALHVGQRYAVGGSMPGGVGVLIGRTPDVAWGATYAVMDSIDSWVERCKDGKHYREPDRWIPFRQRREIIRRKRKEPVEITFYENDHGVLDGDPYREGYYLATRWAAAGSGGASLGQILRMWHVRTAQEALDTLGRVETAWNFVAADRQGNIGYQMSGLLPKRRPGVSGFVPLAGWKPENDWQGFVPHEDLPRALNPAQGFFVTANNDLNRYGKAAPINLPMGPHRADRAGRLLEKGSRLAPADMFAIQFDVYSTQAEAFMKILRPLLPNTRQGEILREWDLRYSADSEGAFLFEQLYRRLLRVVFGRSGLGEDVVDHLADETGVFAAFHLNFDRVLLSEDSAWFGGRPRDELYRQAAAEALAVEPSPWGKTQRYMMRHLLFGGKLPRWLGFDRGPVTAIGGRATIHQGQIYRSAGRTTTFVPSFRMVVDLSNDECYTNLAGGPSDRRFSRWYCADLKNWLSGAYKTISADRRQAKRRFA